MFFWNSLAFSMIQQMLAIWSLVPLPFLKPAWTAGSSWFTYCWSLAWRILSITLLAYVCIHIALYVCMCIRYVHIHCCCSVPQSCPNICNPMDCSTPDFPLLQSPRACSSPCSLSQWCNPAGSSSVIPFTCLQSFSASGYFSISWVFLSGGESIRASALASVLPMNIQGWFPLGLTSLIIWQSKGLSRAFSNTTV